MSSPQADAAAVSATILAAQQAMAAVRARVLAIVRQLWRALPDYREPSIERFVTGVVPVVEGGQRQVASIVDSYLSRLYAMNFGAPLRNAGVPAADITRLRQGSDPAEVYARPFHLVWRQLHDLPHEPGAVEQAINAGEHRASDLAATDLQLAKTHATRAVLAQQSHVTGYRRVLEGSYSCGLCIVASTLRYHKRQLMPVHPGCDCSVEPIYGEDHSSVEATARVNGELVPIADLPDVHQAIDDAFGASSSAARQIRGVLDGKGRPVHYKDVLITHEHGELGPVLGVRGAQFTGPADLQTS